MTCRIAISTGNTFTSILCIEGAPGSTGAALLQDYSTEEAVQQLLACGNISEVGQAGSGNAIVCSLNELYETLEAAQSEYCYVFEDGQWLVASALPCPVELDSRGFGNLADALECVNYAEAMLIALLVGDTQPPVTLH